MNMRSRYVTLTFRSPSTALAFVLWRDGQFRMELGEVDDREISLLERKPRLSESPAVLHRAGGKIGFGQTCSGRFVCSLRRQLVRLQFGVQSCVQLRRMIVYMVAAVVLCQPEPESARLPALVFMHM